MANESIINPSEISSTNPVSTQLLPTPTQTKTNSVLPILVASLVSAALFGFGGYYFGTQSSVMSNNQQQVVISPSPYASSTPTASASESNDWQTYANTAYSYSLSFPSTWKAYDQASGPGVSAATPRSVVVDLIDSAQSASVPYPSGSIVIQHHSEIPALYDSWDMSEANINDIPVRIYENANEASIAYIFTAPEMASFIELRFNASKEVPAYKTFEQIVSTFKFAY